APLVDLDAEKRAGDFIRANTSSIRACTDLSDGGLALAAFELAEAAGVGISITINGIALLYGEDQARYLLAVPKEQAAALMSAANAAGVPATKVGQFGGTQVSFGDKSAPLEQLSTVFRESFGKTFD
ncbi:MAG: AIR synthase-related protein, partial [Pseudomonadota bacterium]